MLANQFTIRDDFPPATFDQWRTLAEADLKGATLEQKLVTHTYDGVDIQPVKALTKDNRLADDSGKLQALRGKVKLGGTKWWWE